ncbi:MAG TPA: TonB-dependent receptor [Gemmatimonadales bacterium]|nr:TonB-dependent receptor [Gemmatimonadales bacterium]
MRDAHGVPIRGAVVGLPGTTLYTFTDPSGRYRLAPVPAGELRVRAAAIGYVPAATTVTVPPADSAVVDFALAPSPLELAPLDVVSTKVPRFGDRPAASVAQVSERDIDRRAVVTIEEAIDRVGGVQYVNGQINIRGSTGYVQGLNSRVLLLVDGVPMNQGDRGGIDWDLVPVDDVERVDILKGAGSSLYGSAALGGVVNLSTRDVPQGVHGRLRVSGGIYADPPHEAWQFRAHPGVLDRTAVTGSYGNDVVGGRLTFGAFHSDGYREQDKQDRWQLAGKTRWQAAPRTRVDVSGAWAVDQYQVPLSWCSRGECDDRGQVYQPFKVDSTERGAHTDSRKGYVAAQVRTVLSERFAWQARGSWLRTHFVDIRRSATEYGVANRFGAEARIEAHPDPARTVLVGSEATLSDVVSDIFGTHSQSEFAAYGESEQGVGAARLHAGARLDFLAVDGGSLSAVASPRIGATLGNFRASVGRGFRAPTVAERFVRTVALGFQVIPNPNLRPETGWSAELGHTTPPLLGAVRVDAALFWTEARDLIEPTLVLDTAGTPQIQLQNVAQARIAGLDATVLTALIPDRLTATLAYTYLSTRRHVAGGTDAPLAFRPRHLLTLAADYSMGAFGVGADFRFSSRPERIELEGFVDPRRVPAKVLDLRADWTRGPLEFRLLVANALDYIYNLVPETLAPVRTVTMTAVWSH